MFRRRASVWHPSPFRVQELHHQTGYLQHIWIFSLASQVDACCIIATHIALEFHFILKNRKKAEKPQFLVDPDVNWTETTFLPGSYLTICRYRSLRSVYTALQTVHASNSDTVTIIIWGCIATNGCVHTFILLFITARKRSLRRLCFYRCLSVHGGGGLTLCPGAGLHPEGVSVGGVSVQGGFLSRGSLSGGSLSMGRGLCPGGICQRDPTIQWRAGGMYPTGMHSCLTEWKGDRTGHNTLVPPENEVMEGNVVTGVGLFMGEGAGWVCLKLWPPGVTSSGGGYEYVWGEMVMGVSIPEREGVDTHPLDMGPAMGVGTHPLWIWDLGYPPPATDTQWQPPKHMASRQYTSYWNAFLLYHYFHCFKYQVEWVAISKCFSCS